MRTCDDVIRQIKAVLFENSPATAEELAGLAQDYYQLAGDANRRLEQCGQIAGRGLTAEALYAAEAPPNLLELINLLDFNGIEQWIEFARARQLPVPPRFAEHFVQLLNGLYERQVAIEPLINEYRRKSIKNSPLPERIAVLRRLRKADPQNPDWVRDEQGLEMHWVKEIADLIQQRGGQLGEDQLASYYGELTGGKLLIIPADGLVEQVRRLLIEKRRQRCQGTFARLCAEANQAYSTGDYSALAARLEQLDGFAEREQTPIPPELEQSLAGARTWHVESLAARRTAAAFETDCRRLRSVLTASKNQDELNQALSQAMRHGQMLPDHLPERTRQAVEKLKTAVRRRFYLLAVSLAAGALAVGVVITLLAMNQIEENERVKLAAAINGCVAARDFTRGRHAIEKELADHPARLKDSRVSAAVSEFDKADTEHLSRMKEFERLCAEMAGLEAGDPAVELKVKRAEELSESNDQKTRLEKLKAGFQTQKAGQQKDRDEQCKKFLEQVITDLDKVRKSRDPEDMDQLLGEANTGLLRARNIPEVSMALNDQRRQLDSKYQEAVRWASEQKDKMEGLLKEKAKMFEDLKKVRALLPDLKAYMVARDALANKYPDAPETGGANDWQGALNSYLAVAQIGQELAVCRQRQSAGPFGKSSRDCFLDFRQMVLSKYPEAATPYSETVKPLAERAQCLAEFDAKAQELVKLLKDPVVAELYEIKVQEGDKTVRYYLRDNKPGTSRVKGQTLYTYRYYDNEHAEKNTPPLSEAMIVVKPALAPHCQLAKQILAGLEEEKNKPDWFSGIPPLVIQTAGREDLNPVLQALLIQKLVAFDAALGGGLELPDALKTQVEKLTAGEIKFMAPGDKKVDDELQAAAGRIKQFAKDVGAHWAAQEKTRQHAQAELIGLWRPLVISGVVEKELGLDPKRPNKAVPLEGEGLGALREYWAVVMADNRPAFLVVAVRDATNRLIWLDDNNAAAVGQPLFSPADHQNTKTLHRENQSLIAPDQPLRCWPMNLDKLPD